MAESKYIRCTCEGCGVGFEVLRTKRFCTRKCNVKHIKKVGTKAPRAEYLAARKMFALENSKHSFYCMCCGMPAIRKVSARNASKGYANKFCSKACLIVSAAKVRDEVEALRRWASPPTEEFKAPALRLIVRVLARVALYKERAQVPCRICANPVGYVFGPPRMYCSKACSGKSPEAIASKRSAKDRRTALKRGASGGEKVDPMKVFDAAGWKCQICHRPTPRKLRATTHKRAPELDHVLPVSRGGPHTYANTQCACRECNAWKSDKFVVGQANLFGLT